MLTPFAYPVYVMAKPAGSRCNLSCRYCYYLGKGGGTMSDELLEEFTRQYIEAQTQAEVLFTWHGGEPLLLPQSYYERAMALQQRYGRGRHIDNCLQTNGTLITDAWCRFFREHNFLIGISIDGPEPLHNHYRQQFRQTLRGIELLKKHGVMWNAMATVNSQNADHPVAFYRFFKEIGCEYLQFTPIVEQQPDGQLSPESVSPSQWGRFLTRLYDEWLKEDVGRLFVQLFDATLANWVGAAPGVCSMSAFCGQSAALQPDGSLYSCDHFVFPQYKLGNIREHTITELMYGERQQRFGREKHNGIAEKCTRCRYLFACHGECPKNRILPGRENYLCAGYHAFFSHAEPTMDFMAAELRAGRAPANVMGSPAVSSSP